MIKPTIGRIVWFVPAALPGTSIEIKDSPPIAALVTQVHIQPKGFLVDLCVFFPGRAPVAVTSTPLVQPGGKVPPDGSAFCEWMPYQVKKEHGSESGEVEAGTESIGAD